MSARVWRILEILRATEALYDGDITRLPDEVREEYYELFQGLDTDAAYEILRVRHGDEITKEQFVQLYEALRVDYEYEDEHYLALAYAVARLY